MENQQDQELPIDQLRDQQAQEILAVLGETLRLENLAFDEDNNCVFTIENRFVFMAYFDYGQTNCIFLNLPLGYLPEGAAKERLLMAMMCGNYCWNLTEGGTLGVDEQNSMVALSYLIPVPMEDKNQINDIIGKLVSVGDYWMRQIEEANSGNAPQASADGGPMMRI